MAGDGLRRDLPVTGPFHLGWTLRLQSLWGAAPWVVTDGAGAWIARRTPTGPATVHLEHQGAVVRAVAWGDGAEDALAAVPALLGLDRDPPARLPAHPRFDGIAARLGGARVGRTGGVYDRLVSVALAQRVTGRASAAATRALARAHGEDPPGPHPGLRLLPTAHTLARLPLHALHPLGIEERRAALLHRVAARATALERALDLPPAEARAHLEHLPGVGPWTSAIVVADALGDPDLVPTADLHLPSFVAWTLAGEPRADDARMLALLEPYAGQRGRVARMIKAAGPAPPRYGPRSPDHTHAGW